MSKKILIVGAGPVGLTAAIELTRRGFSPRIIDRAAGPAGESRAFGIHARTLDILEQAGVTEKLLAAGHVVTRSVFYDDRAKFMQIDFSLSRQKRNYVLMLPQAQTEQILLAALREQGSDVQWNTCLNDLSPIENGIDCCIEDSDAESYDIVIGCDGAHSKVREKLGIGFAGEVYPHDWQLVDVRFSGDRPTDELRVKIIDSNVLAYFPFAKNAGRFVFSGAGVMEVVSDEVDVQEVIWQSEFRISHRIVQSYQQGNVFLAGDAAHIHSPIGGRGMNLGIEDAATLAWLIETEQTDRYTGIRKPIGEKVLRFTDTQTRQITSTNPVTRFLFRRVAPLLMKSKTVQRFAFRRISGADTPPPQWL